MNRLMTLLTLAAGLSACSPQNENADLIIHNAHIYTVDESFSTAEAMAIKEGRILAVGSNREIKGQYKAARRINMQGQFIYPGFIDPHAHFYGYGKSLMLANLFGAQSPEAMIEKLRDHHSEHPAEWLQGRGWDQNLWDVKEFPKKQWLDEAFPGVPALLIRVDGHAALASSEALKRAGITAETLIAGGEVLSQNGEPTGILIDNAINLVRDIIPAASREEEIQALVQAQENCLAVGLTSIGDAGLEKQLIALIDSMHQSGDLKMRIYAMLTPSESTLKKYLASGPVKTDRLHVRSIKLFADGALGSRGARLLEDYSDEPGNRGLLLETPEYLRSISRKALEHGFQVNTHCIGDEAVRLMLEIYGELLGGSNDLRWRIEHAQIVHPDDFDKFGVYSVIPSVQAIHATSDMRWAIDRIGPQRLKGSYALQQLLQQNGWLPNGSDFPIEPINPLLGFHAAFARTEAGGYPEGGFQMENALSREQALRAMTIWAARAQFEEEEKGSLEAGKLADFVVLGQDIMKVEASMIPSLAVRQTWIDGQLLFESK